MLEQKWTLSVESNQYELMQGKLYLIGSSEDNGSDKKRVDIMLKSQTVDVKHCVLDATGTTLCIYDLHSELGTFVNGKRLNSMLKEIINGDVELCIGEVAGHLYPKGNKDRIQLNSSATEIFIVPTQRAPRSSLSNTSTRLFSSPDVSMVGSTAEDDSFNIPETQNMQQRVSMGGNSSLLNTSAKSSIVEKSVNDDSFIPETQKFIPTDETTNQNTEKLIQQSMHQQTDELIRMCTQDFNENLFGEGVDEDTFTSLIIPNIQHAPVILTHEASVCKIMNKDVSNDSSGDAEMEALNWPSHRSKCATADDSEQHTQCLERDDVCTPDLFDFPELAEVNMQCALADNLNENPGEIKGIGQNFKAPEKDASNEYTTNDEHQIHEGVSSGDGYAEEVDMMATQVFIPNPKPSVSHFADLATQVFIPKPKRNEVRSGDANATTENTELFLSGKENMPHTDFGLEQTQTFPMTTRDAKSVNKCIISSGANKSTIDVFDRDLSLIPPTQLFSSKSNNSEQRSKTIATTADKKKQQNLNSTVVLAVDAENTKSVSSFFEDMEDTTDKSTDNEEKMLSCFKKPKQSTSSSKSARSKDSVTYISYSQSETEDLQLCTPKWIVDNFDELTVERNVGTAKKRMLFGSDSEDEPEAIELNNLVTKKDSKDFERLLANVKGAKPPTKVLESPKSVLVKQEGRITYIKGTAEKDTKNVTISKSAEKQFPNKGEVHLIDNGSTRGKKMTRAADKDKTGNNIISLLEKEGQEVNVNVKANAPTESESPQKSLDSKGKHRNGNTSTSNDQKPIQQPVEKRRKSGKRDAPSGENGAPSSTKKANTREREIPLLSYDSKDKQRKRSTSNDQKNAEQPIEKGRKSGKKITPTLEKSTSSSNEKVGADRDRESARTSPDTKDKKGTIKSTSHQKTDVAPAKRSTRLRSRTSDLDVAKAGSSTSNPSEAKKRNIQTKEDGNEANKRRVTRSRSKTDSQESLPSTKSSSSTRSTKTRKHSIEEKEKITRKDPCSNNSAVSVKSSKPSEGNEAHLKKSAMERKRKVSTDTVSSDDETKRLRSTTRTLQVAMTMVEPKLFQCLLDNSPGIWCLASDPTNADVLVMDKGNRTLKFLIAVAKGIPIVTSNWLESLNSTKTVPRGITHFFKDKEFEKRHKFSLLKSLELARKRKLFEGYDFLTTPSILPQPPEMKQIIECAGGKVHSETPPEKPNQNVYVISSWNDKKHWHKYRRSNANIRITSSEGIMESVMRQTTTPLDTHIFV